MLRIWSWNVRGCNVWEELADGEVDVALLQEAPPPPADWPRAIAPHPGGGWETAGWAPGTWSRRTAVAAAANAVTVTPWPLVGLDEPHGGGLVVSRPGTLAAAHIDCGDERVTLVSLYAAWERSADGRALSYADAAAHRLLSDLASVITTGARHHVLAAGDLNILHRYGEHGDRYWAARYATVFHRAEAMGLAFVGPQAPHGRQAQPWPDELPSQSRDVPTFRARGQPMSATRQLDFVFASPALVDRVTVRALNAADEWGPSDHCRILIELNC